MIIGNKIRLRTFRESDVLQVLAYRNDIRNQAPFNGQPLGTEATFLRQYRETGLWTPSRGTLLMVYFEDIILGHISYTKVEDLPQTYTLGYMIYLLENRGKGYTSEALQLFINYLMNTRDDLNRLQIRSQKGNIGSIKAAEKCGFKFEATIKDSFFIGGKFRDEEQYYLLRRDWEKKR